MTRRPLAALFAAAVLTLLLWAVPFGRVLGLPLLWLSTFVHEGGHGLAMLLCGGRFEAFTLFADGSGVARGVYPEDAQPVVSLGGLIGPALVALVLFVTGGFRRISRVVLLVLALFAATSLVVIDGVFAASFVVALSAGLLLLAFKSSPALAQLTLLFLAVQMSLSVFSRSDYLFAATARTGAGETPSDVALVVSHWGGSVVVWGAAIGALSLLLLVAGLGTLLVADQAGARVHAWRLARVRGGAGSFR